MSTSDLYLLFSKSVRHWSEHRNGWGSAPVVWDYLADRYIPEKPFYSFERDHLRKVWALDKSDGLSDAELAALAFTFDNAYIPRGNLSEVAAWFEAFGAQVGAHPEFANRVNHWPAFAAELRKINAEVKDKRLRGVCISCTSVNDIWAYEAPDRIAKAWPICEVEAA